MKIFKHRGDIYISKYGYKSSREERILITLLVAIVVLTIVFLGIMAHHYSSFAEFIAGDEVTVSEPVVDEEIALPDISGKFNFLVMETDDEQSSIHYIYLVQMNADSKAYKACTLLPDMVIDGKSIEDLYITGGGALVQSTLVSYLGIDIDYYIAFTNSNFVEFVSKMGSFVYPNTETIKFSGGTEDDTYSLRISDGEQNLTGNDTSNLMRYYSNEKVNFNITNEIVLYGITQLFNESNFNDSEKLFRLMLTNSSTNITVRNFEDGKNILMVFCLKNTDITVYSCNAEYNGKKLTNEGLKDIKGYFN